MKLRWGVIGCSDFAARRSIPAMRAASLVDLVAIASRAADKLMFDSISKNLMNGERLYFDIEDAEQQAQALNRVRQAMG